jgi:uncharacterized protein YbbC (DUF1343 family)
MRPSQLLVLCCTALCVPPATLAPAGTPTVAPGIETLRSSGFEILRGKSIGLITNPTGVDGALRSSIDMLFAAPAVRLVALFGPEHGVRGTSAAGEYVSSTLDSATGLPVYSLYGRTRKPTPDMLTGIDALVYDIQDIGCRSYTYISTMGLAMEAAADAGIEFIVLDRPNPLGGMRVEGNDVEEEYRSVVGQFPIPYVYGLTCGELARYLNDEGLLAGGKRCRLIVVPMSGWRRGMRYEDTGLPWVPTSPHVPAPDSPFYYVATGVLGELGVISEGVGYTIPFRTFAAEWINGARLAERMNALHLPGVLFRPIQYTPFYGRLQGRSLGGVQIHFTDLAAAPLLSLQFHFLEAHNALYPGRNPFVLADSSRLRMFDRVIGTRTVRELFARRMRFDDVKEFLRKDVDRFVQRSRKYWLYPE